MNEETLELSLTHITKRVDEIRSENREEHKQLHGKVDVLSADVAALKVKSGVWGLIGGAIPTSLLALWFLIKGFVGK